MNDKIARKVCTAAVRLCVMLALPFATIGSTHAAGAKTFLYVSNSLSGNISGYEIDTTTGSATPLSQGPVPVVRPVGLAAHPSGRFVYVSNYVTAGSVSGFAVDPVTGALAAVPGSPIAAGDKPYSVAISPSGAFLFAANFDSNDVSVYRIDPASGSLTSVGPRVPVSSPYMVAVSPGAEHVYIPSANDATVSAFELDGTTGALTPIPGSPFAVPGISQSPTAPPGFGAMPGYVALDPSGRFAYVSGLASYEIIGYARNQATGALTLLPSFPVPTAPEPFQIKFSPTASKLYVSSGGTPFGRVDGSIATFTVDSATGALTPSGTFLSGSATASIDLTESGAFVYGANAYSDTVTSFAISLAGLTPLAGSPLATGSYPVWLTLVQTAPTPSFGVCALFDQDKAVRRGATLPVKIQVCDSAGNNLSSASLTVHATSIVQTLTSATGAVQDSGNANPDNDFRYSPTLGGSGGYIFNLSTKAIATGTYRLNFTIGGGSDTYRVEFQVR
jgi:6-phosphogluconolactonase (cycloisomerase 2 family)